VPRAHGAQAARPSLLALRSIARRLLQLTAEERELAREIEQLTRRLVPQLLDQPGIGPHAAAQLVLSGHTEGASAPKQPSHGSPAPHRSQPPPAKRSATAWTDQATANSTAPSINPRHTQTHRPRHDRYIQRRLHEGKTRREANRCLKRYLVRSLYRLLEHGPRTAT